MVPGFSFFVCRTFNANRVFFIGISFLAGIPLNCSTIQTDRRGEEQVTKGIIVNWSIGVGHYYFAVKYFWDTVTTL